MARKRWTGTTTQRGYGSQHQKARRKALQHFTPGQPCPRCGQPIWNPALADLGHTTDRTAYVGLEHRSCNRADGARRKNRGQRIMQPRLMQPPPAWQPSRQW